MKRLAAGLAIALMICSRVEAQDCPDTSPYRAAREVIRDLGRIVAPNGIQESWKTPIGGIDQWLNARGQNRANPLILFVHGGPAAPMTYGEADPDAIGAGIRIERYVEDAIEVAEHLRKRYGKEKIVLLGHSWGSIVGFAAALERPDLFHAYVGIGQGIDMRRNEEISYEYAVAQARAHRNDEAIRELESIAPYPGDEPLTRERINLARKWAQHYGGLSAFRQQSKYYLRAPYLSPEYDASDVCAIDRGSVFTLDRILRELLAVDFSEVRSFPIPVVVFMGRHDYTTPSAPTAAWLAQVRAPYKQAVWFERSAHMIPWEEPGKFLVSLIEYVRPLAVVSETDADSRAGSSRADRARPP